MKLKKVFTIGLLFFLFLGSFDLQAQNSLGFLPTVHMIDGNDKVAESFEPLGDNRYVRFALSVATDITWWKALKIYDKNNRLICVLSTQDDNKGPVYSAKIPISKLKDSFKITFWKAKAFGVHTKVETMYFSTDTYKGKDVSFHWRNDY